MTTETDPTQQPNPGQDGNATDVANPPAQQGTDPAKVEGQDGGGDKPNNDGPPESYVDFALPDGYKLEGERKDATMALFRDLGLSQERAQKAIDHFINTVGEDDAVRTAAAEAAFAKQREDWGNEAKAELGDKYDEAVNFARTAVQAINSPKLTEAFNAFGWGNHPELIKAFAFFGKAMRDSPTDGIGSTAGTGEKSIAERMYPSMSK